MKPESDYLIGFRDHGFRVLAIRAFKGAPFVARMIRLDASEHHLGPTLRADRSNNRVRPLRGRLKAHDTPTPPPAQSPDKRLRHEPRSVGSLAYIGQWES